MNEFKVKCISGSIGTFTVGKTYSVKDGMVSSDIDSSFGVGDFNCLDDINEYGPFRGCGIKFEKVEESKMFTKADLRNNDWCVLSDGSVSRVLEFCGEKHLIWGEHDWLPFSYYDSSMRNKSEDDNKWDIQKVIRPTSAYMLKQCAYKSGKVVFDRATEIGCEQEHKFKVGDYVTVSDMGSIYTTYEEFVKKMLPDCKDQYIPLGYPHQNEALKIVARGKHLNGQNDFLYIVKDKTTRQVFVFGEEGLEKA